MILGKHFRIMLIAVLVAVIFGAIIFLAVQADVGNSPNTAIVDMTQEGSVNIVLTEDGFNPQHVRIKKGTMVTFSTTRSNQFWPASNLHPSHSIYSDLDPRRPIIPNETWSFVFDKNGAWGIHDHIRSYFTGVIYVSE